MKNLTINNFNKQKILFLSLSKLFLDRGEGQILPHLPVQIGCENRLVDIGLILEPSSFYLSFLWTMSKKKFVSNKNFAPKQAILMLSLHNMFDC